MTSKPMNQTVETDRRTFFLSFIYGLWGLMSLMLAIPASIYLLWPPRPKKEDPWTEAGRVSELQLDTPAELVFRKNRVDGWKVSSEKTTAWAVKISEKGLSLLHPNVRTLVVLIIGMLQNTSSSALVMRPHFPFKARF